MHLGNSSSDEYDVMQSKTVGRKTLARLPAEIKSNYHDRLDYITKVNFHESGKVITVYLGNYFETWRYNSGPFGRNGYWTNDEGNIKDFK